MKIFETMFWNLYAKCYDLIPKHFKPYKNLLKEADDILHKYIKESKKKNIIDLGCGTGNFSIMLAKKGHKVIGVDLSDSMLSIARKKKDKHSLTNVSFHKCNLEKHLEIDKEFFDYLICVHALYVLKRPQIAIEQFYNLLKKGGIAIIINFQEPLSIPKMIKEGIKDHGLLYAFKSILTLLPVAIMNLIISFRMSHGSYHYWTEEEFKNRLKKVGFKVLTVHETYTHNSDLLAVVKK